MTRTPPKPTKDTDFASIAYREREAGLSTLLQRYGAQFMRETTADILSVVERFVNSGGAIQQFLYKPADTSSLLRLVELAGTVSPTLRRKVVSNIMGKINSGTLDNRAVLKNMISLHTWSSIDNIQGAVSKYLVKVADEAFTRGTYLLQQKFGISWEMDAYNTKFLQKFVGKRYTVKDAARFLKPMGEVMEKSVAEGIMLGEHPSKIAQRIQRANRHVNRVVANRDARTTISTVANDCHMDSYKRAGVKRYEVVATYDERTCPVCGSLDGRKFPIEDAVAGRNYPPLHPNCRCTTVAVLSKELEDMMREERIKNGGPAEYMSYEKWYNTYGPGRDGRKFKPVR